MIALDGAHTQRADMRAHLAVAEGEIAWPVIEQAMTAPLCFQRQGKSGIAADIDLLDRVHLDRNGQRHITPLEIRPPHVPVMHRQGARGDSDNIKTSPTP